MESFHVLLPPHPMLLRLITHLASDMAGGVDDSQHGHYLPIVDQLHSLKSRYETMNKHIEKYRKIEALLNDIRMDSIHKDHHHQDSEDEEDEEEKQDGDNEEGKKETNEDNGVGEEEEEEDDDDTYINDALDELDYQSLIISRSLLTLEPLLKNQLESIQSLTDYISPPTAELFETKVLDIMSKSLPQLLPIGKRITCCICLENNANILIKRSCIKSKKQSSSSTTTTTTTTTTTSNRKQKVGCEANQCKCGPTMCLDCAIKHYWTSSNNGTKSYSKCICCRAEFCIKDMYHVIYDDKEEKETKETTTNTSNTANVNNSSSSSNSNSNISSNSKSKQKMNILSSSCSHNRKKNLKRKTDREEEEEEDENERRTLSQDEEHDENEEEQQEEVTEQYHHQQSNVKAKSKSTQTIKRRKHVHPHTSTTSTTSSTTTSTNSNSVNNNNNNNNHNTGKRPTPKRR